jgi:hypothetical protein
VRHTCSGSENKFRCPQLANAGYFELIALNAPASSKKRVFASGQFQHVDERPKIGWPPRGLPIKDTRSDLHTKQKEQNMFPQNENDQKQRPWNKGRLVGQQPPLKLREIWEIRIRLLFD